MPTGSELATGYVTVVADTSRIPSALAQAFGQAADRAGRDFATAFGRAADSAGRDLRQELGQAADQAGRDLSDTLGRAGEQGGQAGGDAAAGGIADSLGGKAGMFGAVLGTVFAAAGVSVGGLFVKALQQGMEREQALDLTQARLGADDETMQRLGTAAGRAYASNFGESVEANLETGRLAITSTLVDAGASIDDLTTVISQLQGVNDLVEGDIHETTKAVGIMLKAGIADNAEEAFDAIVVGYQKMGPAGDDLIEVLREYSAGWKNTGLDAQQAIALISQSIELGSDSTDRGADALREFGRRVTEEEEAIVEALDGIGLNGQEMYDRFAEGGQTAFDAFDEAFDKIRGLEDPVERNTAAMALLGDTAGDFIGTFTQWDPSAAVEKFGEVGGAAQSAIDTMGANTASSIESAKRSIEVSTDGISSALAQAFGPELEKVATWVSEHQPEILGFFGDVADAALLSADGFLVFASNSLRAFGMFAEGASDSLASVTDPLGLVAELFGKLTGDSGLTDLGSAMQDLDSQLQGAADGAYGLADAIDQQARPKLWDLRDSVAQTVGTAVQAQEMFRALGDTVFNVPDEKTITISDNSPEAQQRFAELGIKIEQIPGSKEFQLVAATAEGQQRIDQFISANSGREIELIPRIAGRTFSGTVTVTPNALGGIVHAGDAAISNRTINQWAEAGPEAYIPLSPDRRGRAVPIWMEAGRRLGMIDSFAAGGVVLGKSFAQSMDPVPYAMGGFSRTSIDCSGMVAATVNAALGLPPFSERMSTVTEGQWLAAKGAVAGRGGPGDIGVSWYDRGGGANGHTAMTLSDGTNVESNGSEGVVIGGPVGAGHSMFDRHMHFPAEMLRGGDLGGPAGSGAAPAGAGGSGGTGAPGGGTGGSAGAPGALGGSTGGGTFGGQEVPAGVVPVWIIGPDGQVSPAPGSGDTAAPEAAPAESFAPQDTGGPKPAEMPDVGARLGEMGRNFAQSNFDQFLGDLGLRSSGGAIHALVDAVVAHVAEQTAAGIRQAEARQRGAAAPWMR